MQQDEKVIKVIEVVPPKDYGWFKTEVENLTKENERLKRLLSEGKFSDLENMVTGGKMNINAKCKAIAFEFSACKYSKKNRQNLNSLIETLETAAKQLKDLL